MRYKKEGSLITPVICRHIILELFFLGLVYVRMRIFTKRTALTKDLLRSGLSFDECGDSEAEHPAIVIII
jgi:hypothetical protein